MLSMLALLEVACPLAAFGGSTRPCLNLIMAHTRSNYNPSNRENSLVEDQKCTCSPPSCPRFPFFPPPFQKREERANLVRQQQAARPTIVNENLVRPQQAARPTIVNENLVRQQQAARPTLVYENLVQPQQAARPTLVYKQLWPSSCLYQIKYYE